MWKAITCSDFSPITSGGGLCLSKTMSSPRCSISERRCTRHQQSALPCSRAAPAHAATSSSRGARLGPSGQSPKRTRKRSGLPSPMPISGACLTAPTTSAGNPSHDQIIRRTTLQSDRWCPLDTQSSNQPKRGHCSKPCATRNRAVADWPRSSQSCTIPRSDPRSDQEKRSASGKLISYFPTRAMENCCSTNRAPRPGRLDQTAAPAENSDSSNTAPRAILAQLPLPPHSPNCFTTTCPHTGLTPKADYSEESAASVSWRRAPTTGSGARRATPHSPPRSTPRRSHGDPTIYATRQCPHGLTRGYPPRRSRSRQDTASRSCSRSTQSASQDRKIWHESVSKPRCARRSASLGTSTLVIALSKFHDSNHLVAQFDLFAAKKRLSRATMSRVMTVA